MNLAPYLENSEEIISEINTCLINNRNKKKIKKEMCDLKNELDKKVNKTLLKNIDLLFELLFNFVDGNLSEDVLDFYLKKQLNVTKEVSEILIKNLNLNNQKSESIHDNIQMTSKVSVIITTYNRKKYLNQAIRSILNQNYHNLEIIVIDDNSTDGTKELMIKSYDDNERVIYYKNTINKGPGINRKFAFKKYAQGDYILFLDDDDYLIDKKYLSKAIEFHTKHPNISFVAADVFYENSKNNQLIASKLNLDEIVDNYDYFMHFEKSGYPKPVSTLTAVFKRDSLIKMNILDMKMVNDSSIYLRSLLVGDAGYLNTIVGVYRIHGNNITFNLTKEFIIENLNEKKMIKKIAVNKFGYDANDMEKWFDYNAYVTISYYIKNSAKKYKNIKFMLNWSYENCSNIYKILKRESKIVLIKNLLLKFASSKN
ncbi:glycosyltransferase family 2 protein [Terrilactibacillus laevilacticus]|uniref:Glycosyltransferase family 2 protein n=1 Tax=Terrilactibacillus laevilacticus TaxID=1380157 RepID=A0ABW5PM74_9BACI|nr:glycosyltransferase family 2 protein [Terrilactibacillus laevilacticus]